MAKQKGVKRKPSISLGAGRKRRACVQDFDASRFTCLENQQWFQSTEKNAMVVEKTVHKDVDVLFDLRGAFRNLGWEPMLDLGDNYCPTLVREFYANMHDKNANDVVAITSWVRGKDIKISHESLERLLNISNEGFGFTIHRGVVTNERSWRAGNVLSKFNVDWSIMRNKSLVLAKFFNIRERLLAYMLSHNIIPKASGFNEVRQSDLYIMDKMCFGFNEKVSRIRLASVITNHIHEVAKSKARTKAFIFPVLLSKIISAAGVTIDDDEAIKRVAKDELDFETLHFMGFRRVNGEWRNLELHPLTEGVRCESLKDIISSTGSQSTAHVIDVSRREPFTEIPPSTSARPPSEDAPPHRRSLLSRVLSICRDIKKNVHANRQMIEENKVLLESVQHDVRQNREEIGKIRAQLDASNDLPVTSKISLPTEPLNLK